MKRMVLRGSVAAMLVVAAAGVASAQTTVTLPDSSQTTTLTATVSDQATVTVPTGVTFTVTDILSNTSGSAAAVTVSNIVVAAGTNQLKISVRADAANFTPPIVAAPTWAAADVSWTGGTWTAAVAAPNALSSAGFTEVATCTAGVAACSTTDVTFTLAAKGTVTRSGDHTLSIHWKFESI